MGIEPMTSSLPRKCSTTELQQRVRPTPLERESYVSGVHLHPKAQGVSRCPRRAAGGAARAEWSGRWESNPRYQLGRLKFYR